MEMNTDPLDEITFTVTFTLKDGESTSVAGLPGGTTYVITEAGTEGYTPSANGQTGTLGGSLTVNGTIDGDATAAYTNTYGTPTPTPVYEDGTLTIGKTVVNGDPDQEFTFTLTITMFYNPDDPWSMSTVS